MTPPVPACDPSDLAGHCVTCGDDGVPMSVLRVDADRGLALCVSCAGPRRARATVETALVEPVAPGEVLLVHAGTAIGRGAAP